MNRHCLKLLMGTIAVFGFSTTSQVYAQPGQGMQTPPPPPVINAIDIDKDGTISPSEISQARASLLSLDANKDGEIAGDEMIPAMFRGRGRGGRGPGGLGPFGDGGPSERVAPENVNFKDGIAEIKDEKTYHELAYKGPEVMIDTFLRDLEFVKFTLDDAGSEKRQLYFINTKTHRAHMMFARVAGLPFGRGDEQMKGVLVYRPNLNAPNGEDGLFTFEFEPFDAYSFELVQTCQRTLIKKMPLLIGRIGYYPRGERATGVYWSEKSKYETAGLPVYMDSDLVNADANFLPLNLGESFGRLRVMNLDERPSPRDVVLYRSLPNEMPRVAGIITEVRQTPLSHVNLRAVQDKIPNAFIAGASGNESIKPLIGSEIAYKVTRDGFEVRAATAAEVEIHFAKIRPVEKQVPPRDLSMKEICSLDQLTFEDSERVGVKASNLAALRTFGLPSGTVPDGFAVPFYFYDEFMKHNDYYQIANDLLKDTEFQSNPDKQNVELKKFRRLIENGKMPEWMLKAFSDLHHQFPAGTSLRCRSSTNNEDLPGFSGAGLYDSYTHKSDEGDLADTIKKVYASLWNFRAFDEREFYRVDHLAAAMGVLVHPNYKGEKANGVAVTDDILYGTLGNYYVNTQVGEDLVTNPDELSIPEEILLDWNDANKFQVMRLASRSTDGKLLMSTEQVRQLCKHLGQIHARFAKLYGKDLGSDGFSIEIEFKIDKGGQLVIKQARPWVYTESALAEKRSSADAGFGGGFGGPGGPPGGFGGPGGPRGMPPIALITALDSDGDRKLSATELDECQSALNKLDKNGDGSLSSDEIGWPPNFGFLNFGGPPGQ